MQLKRAVLAATGTFLCLAGGAVAAESRTVSATIPWEGRGQIFRIGPQSLIFVGRIKGIVYAERDDGVLNEGFMVCPITQRLNVNTLATSGVGQCEILVDRDDVIYAEFVCEGQVGSCEGEFRLTGGGGRFKGISGSSKMKVRSPLQVLAVDIPSGSDLRVATGLAQLPELRYEIPE